MINLMENFINQYSNKGIITSALQNNDTQMSLVDNVENNINFSDEIAFFMNTMTNMDSKSSQKEIITPAKSDINVIQSTQSEKISTPKEILKAPQKNIISPKELLFAQPNISENLAVQSLLIAQQVILEQGNQLNDEIKIYEDENLIEPSIKAQPSFVNNIVIQEKMTYPSMENHPKQNESIIPSRQDKIMQKTYSLIADNDDIEKIDEKVSYSNTTMQNKQINKTKIDNINRNDDKTIITEIKSIFVKNQISYKTQTDILPEIKYSNTEIQPKQEDFLIAPMQDIVMQNNLSNFIDSSIKAQEVLSIDEKSSIQNEKRKITEIEMKDDGDILRNPTIDHEKVVFIDSKPISHDSQGEIKLQTIPQRIESENILSQQIKQPEITKIIDNHLTYRVFMPNINIE